MTPSKILLLTTLAFASVAQAQTVASTSGTMVVIPASAEVKHANDQAVLVFAVEEHDKDKQAAAARVNRIMKEGTEIVRKADSGAELTTRGYYTYPIYPEQPPRPLPAGSAPAKPVPVSWRVGQYLEVKTQNLLSLPKTAAAGQKVMSINSLTFGLTPATEKLLDEQRIAETYRNLNERIVSIANAMGRKPSDAVIEVVDFEGSGRYAEGMEMKAARGMMAKPAPMADAMPEPSFEPGETTLQMNMVGKVKFK